MIGNLIDIFNADAFTMVSMTAAIEHLPHQPQRIAQMGLFQDNGVSTPMVMIEESHGVLRLLPTVPRGGPATKLTAGTRKARGLLVPHIPYETEVKADDVLGVRKFGSTDQNEGVSSVVNSRLAQMKNEHAATLEHLQIGALHGNILDSDGSTVIYNLFDEFEVTENSASFELDVATTDVRGLCLQCHRDMRTALGGIPFTGIHAFCGATFFNGLISHDLVKTAYERWKDGEALRNDPRTAFQFGNIMFEEYYGSVNGVDFIDAAHCRMFPLGVPGLFETIYAPADFVETVGTIGQPLYAKQAVDLEFQRWVRLHVQSNPLPICYRPKALLKRTHT